jgi:cellobiose phosphorylase
VKPVIAKYLDPQAGRRGLRALRAYWDGLLGICQVTTPDMHTNRMVNIWNAYQCMATFNMSRSASFFESGIGRGLGFRDSNQDLLGFVHMVPAARPRAHPRPGRHAAAQRRRVSPVPAAHQARQQRRRRRLQRRSALADRRRRPISRRPATGASWTSRCPTTKPGSEQPLYEHLQRSFRYTLERLGPHGLPLIGRADWNDCLNLNCFSDTPGQSFQTTTNKDGKVAESVFIAGLFVLAGHELAAIAEHRGLAAEAATYRAIAAKMEKTVHKHGWDGEWFLRAYDDFGARSAPRSARRARSSSSRRASACWPASAWRTAWPQPGAGFGRKQHLATKHGIVLQQPAYSYYLELGEISSYPPGYKENAGIFCHNNPWVMIAETMLGNGDQAHDYYTRINPSAREEISDLHRCEPYVYAQMIAGKDAPPSARPRTPGSPARRPGTTTPSRSGSWASAPRSTAWRSLR